MRVVLAIVTALLFSPPALAHGPCGDCLSVFSGPAGTKVRITRTTAYWVIWNGRGLPQDGALRPHYRSDARTINVVNLAPEGLAPLGSVAPDVIPEARRDVAFRVPRVPEGRYAVVIYDGSEAGEHYTWDLFTVTAGNGSASHWTIAALAAAALALLAVGLYGLRRSIAQPSPSRR